ncbi:MULTISPECIES: sensor domain-containing diguanylate cyclase [unclassified Petrotoga]|uniref:sensor domain-containing diguanylate cyclase n=1 Tax=unclassified Petrotoga TaxID=2620614 RepID=UPI000EF14EB4|nr:MULTISPECIES: sensor domain-containing diguanylate cyclase [unclassified Petrotoga]
MVYIIISIVILLILVYVFYIGIKTAIYVRRIANEKDKPPAFAPPSPKKVIRHRFKGSLFETAITCLENEVEKDYALKSIIEKLPLFLKADSWSFFLTSPNDEWRFLFWSKDLDFLPLEEVASDIQINGEHIKKVINTKKIFFIKDTKKNSLWNQKHSLSKSWLGIPITVKNEIIGVLNVDWFKQIKVSPFEKELINYFLEDIDRILKTVFSLHEQFLSSELDILTQVYNRTALERYISQHKSDASKKAVIFLDFDNFKKINDNFGHTMGDQALKILTKRIQNSIKSDDLIFRFGGDEFVIIINEITENNNIDKIIQRIKSTVETPITIIDTLIISSISIGYCLIPEEAPDIEKAVEIADKRMYLEKEIH